MSKTSEQAQNPILLRFHRLMDAFAKSDDERDFYLDKKEGFIVYADLDKGEKELQNLEREILVDNPGRYCIIPKMTYYEAKKFMEGFINEKVYDIDTKEKLLDIIQAKEARENFLEFIYDHLTELEKWQQFYQERSRIRIIEWLRGQELDFVFEEDLDFTKNILEKIKKHLFDEKVPKEVVSARNILVAKAKTYYSNEALNPRPKRGRPPKQVVKTEPEMQVTVDMYTTVPNPLKGFLYMPDISNASAITFSSRFTTKAELMDNLRGNPRAKVDHKLQALSERLESLRHLSGRLMDVQGITGASAKESSLIRSVSAAAGADDHVEQEATKKSLKIASALSTPKEKKEKEEGLAKKVKVVSQIRKKGES